MNWTEANGVSLRYELAGQGKETFVLVHESGGALDSWDEVVPGFQQHFRTLRYDQRGFGHSEKIRGRISLDDMVGDLVGLLDCLGISTPCHLAGSALGTSIAIAFATRYPARAARLVIASPVIQGNPGLRTEREQSVATVEREGMRSYVGHLNTSYPEILRGNRARFESFRHRWLCNDPVCFAAINRMAMDLDLSLELAKITCPTLVLGATHDKNRPPSLTKSIADKIPGSRYVEVASGHFMAMQTPELYVQNVLPFLRNS